MAISRVLKVAPSADCDLRRLCGEVAGSYNALERGDMGENH
jgi:hypothetical protein